MLDFGHIPTGNGIADVQVFVGDATVAAGASTAWKTWLKPRGKTMCNIFLLGRGGNGGTGVVGANSTAAGGGGGGSSGMTLVTMPMTMLPDVLFLYIPGVTAAASLGAFVSIYPDATANNCIAYAIGGANGGNASGATAGTAGNGGPTASAGTMPIGWNFAKAIPGQNGVAGGTTGAAGALTLPVTGLLVTGGTGGAGLGAAGSVGTAGGDFTAAGAFPTHKGGIGGSAATTPPQNGTSGYQPIPKLGYWYGGTGGGSTHGSASGAGLVQASGGHGAFGCGGGGSGGALTGSTAGQVGMGGPGLCIITCW